MIFKDQLNTSLHLPKTPLRIISLVPSQTELLVTLGLRKNLVGITKFCVHPQDLKKEISIVGGTKIVNFEKIASIKPDIILCNKEENTKEIVETLQKIAPVYVSDITTIIESLEMISDFGKIFQREKETENIKDVILKEMESFSKFTQNISTKKVCYVIWKNPYMIAGTETFINELLLVNRFENISNKAVAAKNSRYPEVDEKFLAEADLVLLSSEPFPFKKEDAEKLEKKIGKPVILVDGEFFSWYGSRLMKAFNYFKTLQYVSILFICVT